MSILIKGMAMPDCCWNCPLLEGEYGECNISRKKIKVADGRLTDCPLIELPDHGDLIDQKEIMREFSDFVRASNNSDFAEVPTWNDAVSLVGSAPVVIQAERGESICAGCERRSDKGCSYCPLIEAERSEE